MLETVLVYTRFAGIISKAPHSTSKSVLTWIINYMILIPIEMMWTRLGRRKITTSISDMLSMGCLWEIQVERSSKLNI